MSPPPIGLETGLINFSLSEMSAIGLFSAIIGYVAENSIHRDLEVDYPGQQQIHKKVEIGLSIFMLGLDTLTILVLPTVLDVQNLQGITPIMVAALLPGQLTFAIRAYHHSHQ